MQKHLDLRLLAPAICAWVGVWVGLRISAQNMVAAAFGALSLTAIIGCIWCWRIKHQIAEKEMRRNGREKNFCSGRRKLKIDANVLARHRRAGAGTLTATVLMCLGICAVLMFNTATQIQKRENDPLFVLAGGKETIRGQVIITDLPKPVRGRSSWRIASKLKAVGPGAGPLRTSDQRVRLVLTGLQNSEIAQLHPGVSLTISGKTKPGSRTERYTALIEIHQWHIAEEASSIQRAAHYLRHTLAQACSQLPADQGALVMGMVIGDDRALSVSLDRDMKITSLTHLTAVSGQHVAILLALLSHLLGLFPKKVPRSVNAGIQLVVLTGLLVVVTGQDSVIRAGISGVVTIVAFAAARPGAALSSLLVGTVTLLLYDPWLAYSYGFALSVLATLGIVLVNTPMMRGIRKSARRLGLPRPLANIIAASCATPLSAQIFCLPILILIEPSLPIWSLPANILAAMVVAPLVIIGVGTMALAPVFPAVGVIGAHICGLGAAWIAGCATWFAVLPLTQIAWIGGPGGAVLTALGGAAVTWLITARRDGCLRDRVADTWHNWVPWQVKNSKAR